MPRLPPGQASSLALGYLPPFCFYVIALVHVDNTPRHPDARSYPDGHHNTVIFYSGVSSQLIDAPRFIPPLVDPHYVPSIEGSFPPPQPALWS